MRERERGERREREGRESEIRDSRSRDKDVDGVKGREGGQRDDTESRGDK